MSRCCSSSSVSSRSSSTASTTWRQFEAVAAVLRQYGALDEWAPTELGELVAEVAVVMSKC